MSASKRRVVVTQRFFDKRATAFLRDSGCEVHVHPLAPGQADGDLSELELRAAL